MGPEAGMKAAQMVEIQDHGAMDCFAAEILRRFRRLPDGEIHRRTPHA
jgi:hypothetical protein